MTNERRAELQELATITPCFNDLAQQIAREALAEAEAAKRMREAIRLAGRKMLAMRPSKQRDECYRLISPIIEHILPQEAAEKGERE